jgi:hypothetical protein
MANALRSGISNATKRASTCTTYTGKQAAQRLQQVPAATRNVVAPRVLLTARQQQVLRVCVQGNATLRGKALGNAAHALVALGLLRTVARVAGGVLPTPTGKRVAQQRSYSMHA